ncbi:39S ribosomal protein L37 mitochondrial [Schistosoma japonicum]|nr:39S ribosomal protein L37 mitochondrial [Schistosoma japonicum]
MILTAWTGLLIPIGVVVAAIIFEKMRVTEILCRGKRIRHDKLQFLTNLYWRKHGSKLKVNCLRVPEQVLNDPNNPLKEAENMFKSTRYDDALLNEIEIGITSEEAKIFEQQKAERLQCFNPLFGDIRFHQDSEPSLIFSSKRRFSKGVDQASLLTNTVVTLGAPPTLNNLFDKITELDKRVNSDNSIADWRSSLRLAVERSILHAHVWQTDETKLPRRFHQNSNVWKHKPEYGIHPEQSTRYLFHNLFRILEFQAPRYMNFTGLTPIDNQLSNGLPSRWTTRDRLLETFYHWGPEKRRINFSEQHDLVIMGQTPAPLFLTDHETIRKLSQIATMPVAGFGPMSPLIDLTSTLYYRENSTNGWLGNQVN